MIQKVSFIDKRLKTNNVKPQNTQYKAIPQSYAPAVSFEGGTSLFKVTLLKVGASLKKIFSNSNIEEQVADPYLHKSLAKILEELKAPDLFKRKVILTETDSGKVLKLIHPTDGGMERVITFDKNGSMTNLVVYHPEHKYSKREFSVISADNVAVKNYK